MAIVVTAKGTRGVEWRRLPRPVMSAMFGLFHLAFKAFGGHMRVQGRPLIQLETVGAKSGATRHTVLGWFPETSARPATDASTPTESWLVVASNAGAAAHPAWFLNMAKHPDQVLTTIGKRRVKVICETLEGAERERAWKEITSLAPGYARYEENTDRIIPIIRLKAQEEQR
jgi:deazaflavin-dependent oxidoreductase (nitroreductase family)